MKNEKNNKIFKKEDMGSAQWKKTGHRHNPLAGRKRIRGVSADFVEPVTNRMDTVDGDCIDDRRRNSFVGKKGSNKKIVGQNKTEKEVNSLMKVWLKINIKLNSIINFFNPQKIKS